MAGFTNVTNSFWNYESSGIYTSEGGTAKCDLEMRDVATYTDLSTTGLDEPWDFYTNPYDDTGNLDIWELEADSVNIGYPYFGWQVEDKGVPPPGYGIEGNPFDVSSANHLIWISKFPSSWSSHFSQTDNINASASSSWNRGKGFEPIGNSTTKFSGYYIGNDRMIDSLYINRPNSNNIGFLGYTYEGEIEKVGISNVDITGNDNVGGLIGNNSNSSVTESFTSGSVTGNDNIGGLIGNNQDDSEVLNNYSRSAVSGNNNIGGLVGNNTTGSTISKSYSTGEVNGIINIAGLVGANDADVNNSFWDTQTSGQSTSSGGTGKTTVEMKDVATFTDLTTYGLDNSWDFVGNPNDDTGNNDYWNINAINDGYPYLTWQGGSAPPAAPSNVSVTITYDNVQISWDTVAGASSYKVYSSDDPYTGFTEDTSGSFAGTSWSAPLPVSKKFYYVKAVN